MPKSPEKIKVAFQDELLSKDASVSASVSASASGGASSNLIGFINLENFDEEKTSKPILTSPRSIEVCRMLGIDPEELVKKPIEFFSSSGNKREDQELVFKRASRYERQRHLHVENARAQRRELIEAEMYGVHAGMSLQTKSFCRSPVGLKQWSQVSFSSSNTEVSTSTPQDATVIEREKKRLERLQYRQVMEMQQMLAFELKSAELQAEKEKIEKEQTKNQQQILKEKLLRQKEQDEKKRVQQIEKNLVLKKELKNARQMAFQNQMNQYQKRQKEEKKMKQKQKLQKQSEIEKIYKKEQQQLQIEENFQKLQREFHLKQQEMYLCEQKRFDKMENLKKQKQIERKERQEQNKMRILSVLQDQQNLQKTKEMIFLKKQQESEKRRHEFDQNRLFRENQLQQKAIQKQKQIVFVQDQLIQMEKDKRQRLIEQEKQVEERLRQRDFEKQKQREIQMEEEKMKNLERKSVYEKMEQHLEAKQQEILMKSTQKMLTADFIQEQKFFFIQSRLQEAKLKEEEIQYHMKRQQRQDAYRMQLLLSKIEQENKKTNQMKKQKEDLLKTRQEIKKKAFCQKKNILQSFEKMKITKKFHLPLQLVQNLFGSSIILDNSMHRTTDTKSVDMEFLMKQVQVLQKNSTSSSSNSSSNSKKPTRPSSARPPVTKKTMVSNSSSTCSGNGNGGRPPRPFSARPSNRHEDLEQEEEDTRMTALKNELDTLRREQNEELLNVLEEEHHAEEQREYILLQVTDSTEKKRLEGIFDMERAKASERIMRLTQNHEAFLAKRMKEFSL